MSPSSQQNSVPQPVPNNNGAQNSLPWSWKCIRTVPIWSDPQYPPSTVSYISCDTLNQGVDICKRCNIHTAAESARYEVVRQCAPPPPSPPKRQHNPGPRSSR
ncbi:hypothetical protein BGAL_0450g00050 [Botrytis galanthina]|uniref:Uncharacterized protein n=1 Tax=Botrytis galanthina TaxID=278940 RepID=A0A4S8QW42_9HELO|nr:hypothetical protein BGAL_0450g00050 [Botrytis galanthina]